jgi:hypothetical protein
MVRCAGGERDQPKYQGEHRDDVGDRKQEGFGANAVAEQAGHGGNPGSLDVSPLTNRLSNSLIFLNENKFA